MTADIIPTYMHGYFTYIIVNPFFFWGGGLFFKRSVTIRNRGLKAQKERGLADSLSEAESLSQLPGHDIQRLQT